jgi:hypothetical protein
MWARDMERCYDGSNKVLKYGALAAGCTKRNRLSRDGASDGAITQTCKTTGVVAIPGNASIYECRRSSHKISAFSVCAPGMRYGISLLQLTAGALARLSQRWLEVLTAQIFVVQLQAQFRRQLDLMLTDP